MPGLISSSSLFSRPYLLWIWLAVAAIVLGSAPHALARRRHRVRPEATTLGSRTTVLGYSIWIYSDPACGGSYFNLTHAGRILFTSRPLCDQTLRVGALYPDDPDETALQPGSDLTGNGHPDLVVTGFSGGANCCLSYYIFQIGDEFRRIGVIREFDDDHATPHFVRLEPNRGTQIVIHDWTFAGWHANWGDSPAPLVILEYRKGRFRPSPSLMDEPAPAPERLQNQANRFRLDAMAENFDNPDPHWPAAKIPPELWGTMLNLIYTGHAALAWKFADLAWPPRVRNKALFLDEFREQLRRSPYYRDLMALQLPEIKPTPTPTATPSPGYAPIPTPAPKATPTPYPSPTATASPGATPAASPSAAAH